MPIDNHLNWKKCIDHILPKLSTACFTVRGLFHKLSIDVLRVLCFAYFHSVMKYGIIFSGNSTNIFCVSTLQNRIIRIIYDVGANSSCRNIFKKLDILPVSCQYILSLIVFVVDNQKNFQTNLSVPGLDTRINNLSYSLVANLSCFQRCVSNSSVKIVNVLPNNIKNLRNDRVQFKIVPHK